MGQLVDVLTVAYESKRWLLAEESSAMILNPIRFLWHHLAFSQIDDQRMYRDCFFFIISRPIFIQIVTASDSVDDKWTRYAEVGRGRTLSEA